MRYSQKAGSLILPSPNQAAEQTREVAPQWPVAVVLPLFAVLLLICYSPMLVMTGRMILQSDDMAYGFFAPIVALYIAWDKRAVLLHPSGPGSVWSLVFIGAGAAVSLAATLGNSSTFSRLAFIASLAGCLLAIGAWHTLRTYLFPLLLLFFTFPVPDVLYGQITQPLQLLATWLSECLFETLGFSVIREGNILQLVYMRLSVVEACSGLRSLVTLIFFCLIYSYFFETRLWRRIAIVLLAIPSAIAVNALRITATGVLGKYNMEWTEGTYHEVVGWSAFGLGFLLVLLCHQTVLKALPWHRRQAVGPEGLRPQ